MANSVKIKGIKEGLLVDLSKGEWLEIESEFISFLDDKEEFLKGGRLALDVGDHILKATEIGRLRNEVTDRGLILWALLSNSPVTIQTAKDFGLITKLPSQNVESSEPSFDTLLYEGEKAIFVKKTLRSGFSLQFPGHVTVLGDVNPGAEIISVGNILVWGKVRGLVHAGAEGDQSAVICALDLSPTQLRIAGEIAELPKRRGKPKPEMAHLVDGKVIVDAWVMKRRR